MNGEQLNEWSLKSLRSGLSASERAQLEAWLQESPDNYARWSEEHEINRLLAELPTVPLSSNFTQQVLQAVRREQRPLELSRVVRWIGAVRKSWLRPIAATATVGMVVFFVYRRESQLQQKETVTSLQLVSGIATALRPTADIPAAPRFELLEDFEAIRQLGVPNSEPDLTLLAVLQ